MGKKKNRFCLYAPFSCSLLINPPGLSAAAEEALSSAHQICKCRVTHSLQNCSCFLHLQVLSLEEKKTDACCLCGGWSVSKCRKEQGPDLLILFSHRGSVCCSIQANSLWLSVPAKCLECKIAGLQTEKLVGGETCRLTLFTCINAGSRPKPPLHNQTGFLKTLV